MIGVISRRSRVCTLVDMMAKKVAMLRPTMVVTAA